MKFKIGDRVKCIALRKSSYLEADKIYTIKEIFSDCLRFEEMNREHSYAYSRFILARQLTPLQKLMEELAQNVI